MKQQINEAIDILVYAKTTLESRLAERVCDFRDEVVLDAEGGIYSGELDTIYEQLGNKLTQVNRMLADLGWESRQTESQGQQESQSDSDAVADSSNPDSFDSLINRIKENDLDGTANSLSTMLSLTDIQGVQSGAFVLQKYRDNELTIEDLDHLKQSIVNRRTNDAMQLLNTHFGIAGNELVFAFESLTKQLAVSPVPTKAEA